MRVNERYQDVKSNKITETLFLEEARRDTVLRKFISNRNTFEDAVTILKNKGLLFEDVVQETKEVDFLKMFNEGLGAWEAEEDKSTEVNHFEFDKGWRYEFIKAGKSDDAALQKAKDKAIKNLQKDPIFYTRLELVKDSIEHQKKRTDQPLDISKGQNLVDKDNQAKPVKVKEDISSEEYLKAAEAKEEAVLNESVIKEYADGEESNYDEIEEDHGTPEVIAILKKWDNLGFDLPGEAINAILTDKKWKDSHDVSGEDPSDIAKIETWRKSKVPSSVKEGINEEELGYNKSNSSYLNWKDTFKRRASITYLAIKPKGVNNILKPVYDRGVTIADAIKELKDKYKYNIKWDKERLSENIFDSDPLGKLKGKEVSFTTKEGDKLNSVSSKAVSSKLGKDGGWIITLAGNQTLALTKGGIKGIYFKTKDQHEKVADLGQDLKAAADKVFKSENLEEGSINKDYKFYILSVKGYLVAGFNNSDEASNFIKDHPAIGFKKIPAESLSKITKLAPNQDKSWKKLSGINDFMFKNCESEIKEQIKAVLREKLLKEYVGGIPPEAGPDVDKKTLEHELKNYDWYWQNNDDVYLKKLAKERDDKVRKLVGEMGKEGEDLYNEYAPDDLKWGTEVRENEEPIQNQKIKDAKDKSPEELAKDILSKQVQKDSIINAIAYIKIWNEKKKTPDMEDALEILEKLPVVIKFKQKQSIK